MTFECVHCGCSHFYDYGSYATCDSCGWDQDHQIDSKIEQFGDSSCFDFIQLASGKWAGRNMDTVMVSCKSFVKGESPKRFKYESCINASEEEVQEYWDILSPILEKREHDYKALEQEYLECYGVYP
jgi:hypothetical protein